MVYVEVVSNLIGCYQIKKDMADDMEGEYYLRVVLKKITLLKLESKGFEFYLKKQHKKAVRQLSERKNLVALCRRVLGEVSSFNGWNETMNKQRCL